MSFKEFMDLYDNWNGRIRINDKDLNEVIEDATLTIMNSRKDLYDKTVMAFGFYDDILTVRLNFNTTFCRFCHCRYIY